MLLVGSVAVVAVGWGAFLSVRSSVQGPQWALDHVGTVGRFLAVPVVVGVVATILIRPFWVGLALTYVAVMVWWLAGMLRRNLVRLRNESGFEAVPEERRSHIIGVARRYLAIAGAALAVVGLAGVAYDAAVAGVVMALAAVLLAAAVLVGS